MGPLDPPQKLLIKSCFNHVTVKHKVKRRKEEYSNLPNEKFLGVQNPFYKKGFGRRRQK